jgi:DNA-binding transcriptional LysR family regulator
LAVDRIATWPWVVAIQSGHQLAEMAALSASVLREEPFVVYAADADDDGMVRVLWQLLKGEPHIVHCAPNTLTVLTLAAAGMGLAVVPAPFEALNVIPNIAYRRLVDSPLSCSLVLLSRRNEPSPAIRRFIEMARPPDKALGLRTAQRRKSKGVLLRPRPQKKP